MIRTAAATGPKDSLRRLTLALACMVASPAALADTELFSDSGIDGPPYQTIFEATGRLPADYPGWVTVHDYGQTPGGRTLRAVRIQSPAEPQPEGGPRQAVLISGSTHGNEYLNIEDRLAPWFLANRAVSPGLMRFLAAGGTIYIIPILNPDGYDADARGNAAGIDLNRDFDLIPADEQKFTQPETRLLAQWLHGELAANNANLRLTVDYHCCDGSLLFPWSYTMDSLPTDQQTAHDQIAQLMHQLIDPAYDTGSTGQVLGYTPRGTSKDYYFARYGALSFTFEGSYGSENGNFSRHTAWWDAILAGIR